MTKQDLQNNISISLSSEHVQYADDVRACFQDLDIPVEANYGRKSAEELPMQIMIFLTGAIGGGIVYDLLKIGIKKVYEKFKNAKVAIRHEGIMFSVSSNGEVQAIVLPERQKEFEYIKTIDDLIDYLKQHKQEFASQIPANQNTDQKVKSGVKNPLPVCRTQTGADFSPATSTADGLPEGSACVSHLSAVLSAQADADRWVETTLGEVVELIVDNRGRNPEQYFESGIPVIDNVLITGERKIDLTKTKRFIDKNTYEKFIRKYSETGDVLVTLVGNGYGNLAIHPEEKSVIIQNTVGLRMKKELSDNLFIFYYLSVNKKKITDLNRGAAQPSVKVGDLLDIKINLPPLPQQKAIAEMLGAFDDKIELLREQNETLEKIGQEIFKEWFGKYKIGDDLPDGWRVGKLGGICELFDSQRIPLSKKQREQRKGKYPYYGATSIMDYVDEYLFDGTYLLFAEDGSVITDKGYPFLQYVWGKFWVNNHAHILQGKNGFTTEMLYIILKKRKISGIVNGAVQLKINQTNLKNLEIIIPPKEILEKFNQAVKPLFEKIKNNFEQIQTLSQTRDTLLPKLMKGEIILNEK